MSLKAVSDSAISAVLGVTLQSFRPKFKLKKWNLRIEEISAIIDSKEDVLTPKERERFFLMLEYYKHARDLFWKRINDGDCTWYGRGKWHAAEFSDIAREAWDVGLYISYEASKRRAPGQSTSTSLLKKAIFRQASSLSVGSLDSNSDTATASERSILNELPSSSLRSFYPEGVSNGAISVNSEDDTDSEYDSGSDSDSNNMAPEPFEEVEAVYALWRQIPEEKSPWVSTSESSLLDNLGGVITRPKVSDASALSLDYFDYEFGFTSVKPTPSYPPDIFDTQDCASVHWQA